MKYPLRLQIAGTLSGSAGTGIAITDESCRMDGIGKYAEDEDRIESCLFGYFTAITSISTNAPFGISATATHDLAGAVVKCFAYTSLNAEKSSIFAR